MSDIDYTNEEWRPVVGWESLYAVSNMGRVKRLVKTRCREAGSFLKQAFSQPPRSLTGYLLTRLCRPGRGRSGDKLAKVHRLVVAAFIGDPTGMDVNHKNGDGLDNRVCNLEICTRTENGIHATRVLGRNLGEKHGMAKLTTAKIVAIRRLHSSGKSQRELCERFGVSPGAISNVVRRVTWFHVAQP